MIVCKDALVDVQASMGSTKGQGEPSSVPADSMASHCQTGVESAVAIQPNDKDMTLGASSGWTYRAARKLSPRNEGRKERGSRGR